MKTELQKRLSILAVVISVAVIITGIGLVYYAFYKSYHELSDEHEHHLEDLAWSTDRNVGTLVRGISDELAYGVTHNAEAEMAFLEKGDREPMVTAMQNSMLMNKAFIYGMQVIRGDEVLLNVNKGEERAFEYPNGCSTEAPCICCDAEGNEYFSIVYSPESSDLKYAVLIDLNEFYHRICGPEVTGDYWVVLYDENTGLLLQNNNDVPRHTTVDREEALKRNDGISVVVRAEATQQILIESYHFAQESMAEENVLIAVIPTGSNNNGVFAVGVAIGMSHLSRLLTSVFQKIVYSVILVVMGIAGLLLVVYYNRRSNADLQEKVRLLEQENSQMSEIAHHQRLEMIGTMTSSIAHEFNNMLTPIMGYSIMVMEQLPEGSEELMDELGEIYDASERAKTLISRLSALSRKGNSDKTKFSPDTVMEKILSMAKPSIPPMVEIRKEYGCPEECILANETDVGQLFLNIIINAFQELEGTGGVITVRTEKKGEDVEIRIHNTGKAIPKEVLPKLFDPFFTTKEVGKGTGLGLAIARQIAENYGGTILVESSDEAGTAFIIRFPDVS